MALHPPGFRASAHPTFGGDSLCAQPHSPVPVHRRPTGSPPLTGPEIRTLVATARHGTQCAELGMQGTGGPSPVPAEADGPGPGPGQRPLSIDRPFAAPRTAVEANWAWRGR